MSKFNEKKKPQEKVINYDGGVSFKQKAKEELIFATISTFLEDSYYESVGKRLGRIRELCMLVPHEFIANLAVYLRKEAHMRSAFHVLVGELALGIQDKHIGSCCKGKRNIAEGFRWKYNDKM